MNYVAVEDSAIRSMEKRHMKNERRKLYIACEKIDFCWCESEVKELERMWKEGASIQEIYKHFDRPQHDIDLLIYDRSERGLIKPRPKGLEGGT
ncbi:helix-turn-helix domain-containing protein [Alkalihalophilus marmarensis]|uniref:helix-turn-helix domain-containing protein n=1 Tax=Alkalihalophilus marmarensis TaxID=521377 RepID=UPI002DBAF02F|nr:helix-turn-helix domain-containing protein [Alkalihalophilus marmarensis]MEC2070316.1 helix-turn-helix domain-containing protein [Alkalihalophilus marmarensis]